MSERQSRQLGLDDLRAGVFEPLERERVKRSTSGSRSVNQ